MAKSTVESATEIIVDLAEQAPIQVLHVDDELGLLKAVKQILEIQGPFQVETASSVEDALERMKKKTFNVIVSDYVMPGKDGLEFLKELREKGNNIPFIIFTGKGREEVAIKALNLGADQYLNKGGRPETVYGELAHGIRKSVERKRAEAMVRESEERHRTLLNMANVMIQSVNAEGRFVYVNKEWKKVLGYTEKDLQKITLMDVIRKDQHMHCMGVFKQVMEGKSVRDVEAVFIAKDGREIIVSGNAMPRFKDGKFASTVGFFADVTERKKAEEALLKSEERFRSIVENSHDGIIMVDDKFMIIYANDEASHIIGYSKNEIIGQSFMKFLAEESKAIVRDRYLHRQRGESVPSTYEFKVVRKDGEKRDVEIKSTVLRDSQGKVQTIAQMLDITERKKTEDKILQQTEFLNDVLESLTHPFYVIDANDYIIKMANSATGFGTHLEKSTCYELTHKRKKPCSSAGHPCPLEKVKKTKKPVVVEHIHSDNDGDQRYVEVHGYPIFDDAENVVQMLEYCLDITERKHAEEELKQAEEKHRILLDTANVLIQSVNADGEFVYVNKEWKKMLGYTNEDFEKITLMDVIRKDHQKYCMDIFKQVMKGKSVRDIEAVFVAKDGKEVMVSGNARPILKDGEFVSTVGFFADVTERKRAEEALRESEGKFRNIFESANDGIILLSRSGSILDVNEKAAEIFGGLKEELLGKHFTKVGIFSLRDIPRLMASFTNIIRGKKTTINLDIKNKKGHALFLECSASLVKREDKSVVMMVIVRDITKRKEAEKAIRESREKFEQLFMGNPEAAVYLDTDFYILDINPRFAKLFGYSLNEIKDKHIDDVIVPRNKMEEATVLDTKAKEGYVYHDTVRKRKDGTLVPVSISAAPITIEDQLIGYVGVYKDISQLKRTEKQLKTTLEKVEMINEKLGVVGKFTRHDARNKLSTVTMNTFLAKQKLADNHEALEHLNEIESAVREVERIFDFARTYEKLGIEELAYIDVEKSLKEVVMFFSDLHGISVVNDCHGLTVFADSLLRQLFYNLIDNSLKHGEKVSRIRVYYEEIGKDQLKLIYEDNGVGIPKAEKEKIFTEGYGKGTGYGLYLIRKMCEVYGWIIQETGKQDKGAQFTITISKIDRNGKVNYKIH